MLSMVMEYMKESNSEDDIMQSLKPKLNISLAIVFYNPTLEDVKQTLSNIECLNDMKNFNFEFYLIDNASPNQNLFSLLPKNLGNNIHYKLLKINHGFGSGHNSILNELNSDFHIIMNPDIEIKDLVGLDKAIDFMRKHKEVSLLSPMVRNKSNNKIQFLNRKEPTVFDLFIRFMGPNFFPKRQAMFEKKSSGYDHIQIDENATGSFMLIRTNRLKQVHGFDTKFFMYFEDTDLTKRLSTRGKVIFFPYFEVIHGWKRDNHTLKGIIPMLKSMIIYFNKWGWKFY